ncbi:MAG: hypothetical protein ACOZF2_08705 [Thermodesulfobacteriota bacterium]
MSDNSRVAPGRCRWAGVICLCLGLLVTAPAAWGRSGTVEVRRLGLSRLGENTMLTVILNRPVNPRVTTRTANGRPQLVVEFPQAQAGRLPTHLAGDDLLVEQVFTQSAPGGGVTIVLELYPDQPYNFWRQSRPGAQGQSLFILGLTPDPSSMQARSEPSPEAPEPGTMTAREPEPPPAEADDYGYKEERGTPAAPGSFAELRRLIPQAAALLQGLESEGWVVSDSNTYDRPGQRFSRDFVITNQRYPELALKIANLPGNTPLMPSINILVLTTDKLGGEAAEKYRSLRQWSFGKIRTKFEDIGDFFDDALKPLRVQLRKETKAIVLRDAKVFQTFLQRSCPQKPDLSQKFMKYVNQKINQRFEGVQYTLSENPLVILNMVDFLYLKVFFLGKG